VLCQLRVTALSFPKTQNRAEIKRVEGGGEYGTWCNRERGIASSSSNTHGPKVWQCVVSSVVTKDNVSVCWKSFP